MSNKVLIIVLGVFSLFVSKSTYGQVFPTPNGWIDTSGKEVFHIEADSTFYSESNIVRYTKDGQFGFLKLNNKAFKSKTYTALSLFQEGFAVAKTKTGWIVIDSNETIISKINCHYAYAFSDGLARIQLGNRFGFIDTKGRVVIPVQFYGAYDFHVGRARIYKDKKWGFIDQSGKIVISNKYDYVWDYSGSSACVMNYYKRNEQWSFIDKSGKPLFKQKYDYVFPFTEGMAIVRIGDYYSGKLQLIDKEGKKLFDLNYLDVMPFSEDMAAVAKRVDGKVKWGYINADNVIVIDCKYDSSSRFVSGLALVSIEGKKMYINKSGKVIWQE